MEEKGKREMKIAVCGKGESGKSTLVTLLTDEARDCIPGSAKYLELVASNVLVAT
jgi:polynucleotide 5'-kinase involved in rRNA processing